MASDEEETEILVYLADLTHTGQIVASNVFPLGVGLIGANILKEIPGSRVEIFKYPDDLDAALSREQPDVCGFSNYSWTCNLGMEYAKRIKAKWPATIILAGGPNYGSTVSEHNDYWARFPSVDFYVFKEGEIATVQLLRILEQRGYVPDGVQVPGCHRMEKGEIVKPPLLERIKNLDSLPSPYTSGLMDKFYDGCLIPLLASSRGCPFSCTFCTEGQEYYNKVAKKVSLRDELEYCAQRVGTIRDLYFSDANTGMLSNSLPIAHEIAAVQKKYGWPDYIHCSGGKNNKERVLEFASIVGGKMGVSASLQSTNKSVLQNVKRDNISHDQLLEVAKRGSKIDANTFAEIILNLPGDTLEAHTQSLRDAVNSGVSYLRMYQLIMLPETDMNTTETREKFGMTTMWRIMPRCFGRYTFQGEQFNAAEIEEICIGQTSMSFAEYCEARELDLTVEIVHNTGLFRELFGLCGVQAVEWFDLLLRFHSKRRDYLHELYDTFRDDTIKPLWANREEALAFAQTNLDAYLTEQLGTNELFNAKAVAFFQLQEPLHDALYAIARTVFPDHSEYLDEAKDYSLLRKRDLLAEIPGIARSFSFDFPALLEVDFAANPFDHRRCVDITFEHDAEQREMLAQFVRQYGTSTTGLGRIMLRAHIKKLFRKLTIDGVTTSRGFETSYRRSSNLYGD